MKHYILLLFILLLACSGKSDIKPSDTFIRYYGGDAQYELKDMVLYTNNSSVETLVMLGDRTDSETGLTHMYLIQVNLEGAVLNEVDLTVLDGGGLEVGEEFASRLSVIDGGLLVIGTQDSFSATVNNVVWGILGDNMQLTGTWQTFSNNPAFNYTGVDIQAAADGGVVVAGYTDQNGDNDFFYTKIGGTEDPWVRVQSRPGSNDQLVRMLPRTAGGYAIFGRTDVPSEDGEGGVNVERTIVDANGIIQNSLIYGISSGDGTVTNHDDIPYDVVPNSAGYAIVGSSDNDFPFLMLVDLNGSFTEETEYSAEFAENGVSNAVATSLAQTNANDYFIVGNVGVFGNFGGEMTLMKTDQLGNIIPIGIDANAPERPWINLGLINGNDRAVRVLRSSDGSLFVGAVYDFGPGLSQFALLKVNDEGVLMP